MILEQQELQWYKDTLQLAGRLAGACETVLATKLSDPNLQDRLQYMEECLDEYNNAIIDEVMNRRNK
jgi:hypothetical protein